MAALWGVHILLWHIRGTYWESGSRGGSEKHWVSQHNQQPKLIDVWLPWQQQTGPGHWGMWIFSHCHRTLYPKTTSKFQGRDCWTTASPRPFTVLTSHKCKKSTECRHHLLQATLYSQKWSLSDSQLPAPKALEYSCLNCSLSGWE